MAISFSFSLIIFWVVLTTAVRICNQRKDLPMISTAYFYYMISVQVFCAIMSNKLIRFRVQRIAIIRFEIKSHS